MAILVVADHDNSTLGAGTLNTVAAATAMGERFTCWLQGPGVAQLQSRPLP